MKNNTNADEKLPSIKAEELEKYGVAFYEWLEKGTGFKITKIKLKHRKLGENSLFE